MLAHLLLLRYVDFFSKLNLWHRYSLLLKHAQFFGYLATVLYVVLLIKLTTDTCKPEEDVRIAREDPRRIEFNLNDNEFNLRTKNDRFKQRSHRPSIDLPDNFERVIY